MSLLYSSTAVGLCVSFTAHAAAVPAAAATSNSCILHHRAVCHTALPYSCASASRDTTQLHALGRPDHSLDLRDRVEAS